jgi:hypothetical protein
MLEFGEVAHRTKRKRPKGANLTIRASGACARTASPSVGIHEIGVIA